jgi:hypothetical protein
MTSALRRLAYERNGNLAGRAYCDFINFSMTGLLSPEQIKARLIETSELASADAEEAIRCGFAAASKKSGEQAFGVGREAQIGKHR